MSSVTWASYLPVKHAFWGMSTGYFECLRIDMHTHTSVGVDVDVHVFFRHEEMDPRIVKVIEGTDNTNGCLSSESFRR